MLKDEERITTKEGMEKEWEEGVEKNRDDYGYGVVQATVAVCNALDDPTKTYKEAHDKCHGFGITGFMAGCMAQWVSHFHPRGEGFRKWWNSEHQIHHEGDKANGDGGILNPAVLTIGEGTWKDERIEVSELVGRQIRRKDGSVCKILDSYVSRNDYARIRYQTPDGDRYWDRLSEYTLLPADWQPPELEPKPKEEPKVNPLALELRRFYLDRLERQGPLAITSLGVDQPWRYTAEAAKIRALVVAELPEIKVGWKAVRRLGDGSYVSLMAGTLPRLIMYPRCEYVPWQWTAAPNGEGGLAVVEERSQINTHDCSARQDGHVARCLYIRAPEQAAWGWSNTVYASAVMLIEKPVPVGDVVEDPYKTAVLRQYGVELSKPDADEVRELAEVLDKTLHPGWTTPCKEARDLAKAALSWFRSKRPALPACTVSDEEGGKAMFADWDVHSTEKKNRQAAWREAKRLLGATDVDFVVRGRSNGHTEIKPLSQKAKGQMSGYHHTEGWYGFTDAKWAIEKLYHAGCIGLLDENWKEPS